MFSVKSRCSVFITGTACVLFLAQGFAQSSSSSGGRVGVAQLVGPVTWGSPDRTHGKRRPVTAADRAAIQSYRSGRRLPIFSTNFSDPAEFHADWNLVSDDNTWGDYQSCRSLAA